MPATAATTIAPPAQIDIGEHIEPILDVVVSTFFKELQGSVSRGKRGGTGPMKVLSFALLYHIGVRYLQVGRNVG